MASPFVERISVEDVQYYAMHGNRAVWHRGWRSPIEAEPTSDISNVNRDVWQFDEPE